MKISADDIAQLLASSPPRRVPAHVAAAARGGGASSWAIALFGLLFGAFGMIFVIVFFPWRFLDGWRLAAAGHLVPGEIRRTVATSMSVNDEKVVAYEFAYTPADGRRREARCYTTGPRWTPGAAVTVRHMPDAPDVACVEGARLDQAGGFAAFVIIFPLIGGGMVAWFFVDRRRTRRLLHEGQVAEVDVLAVDATSMKVNQQTVYRIVLANPAQPGGPPVTVKRVREADIALALKHAREKQPVFILYDPRRPARVLFPEAMIDAGD